MRTAARRPTLGIRRFGVLLGAAILLPLASADTPRRVPLPLPPRPDFTNTPAAVVRTVEAGNLLTVDLDGQEVRLRLIGTYIPGRGPGAAEAQAFVQRLLAGESVYVLYEPDWPLHDRQERRWAYVFRVPDGLFVNLELVRQGYAKISALGEFTYEDAFLAYERLARAGDKGLWDPALNPPPASQPAADADAEAAADAASDGFVYATPSGSCYHRADCHHVQGKDDIRRMTIAEARAAGLKPCQSCKPGP